MTERKQPDHSGPSDHPEPIDKNGRISVMIEFNSQQGASGGFAMMRANQIELAGFSVDPEFEPVAMSAGEGMSAQETVIVRGTVKDWEDIEELRKRPEVAEVWPDTPIAGFAHGAGFGSPQIEDNPSMAPCPTGSCDCSPGTPKGTIADVATYLGVNQIWAKGYRGTGIVVGVLDSGITAVGRPVKSGETTRRIPRVVGGWPHNWGTESSKWGNHGNMCATDVLGMAPEANLYDLRIAGSGSSPGTISRALQAFQWAINRHKVDGTPHVLTNSWGIFRENWDANYARNPNHPFTRKVVEAINEGILVLFAAGNCGDTCPDGRCGSDTGPGKSIWGANGHPQVMTVGAANKNEQFIGYSSRGPAALDANKPDFCSISHFTGYNTSDSGTSAATPILAGAVALFKQAKPSLTQVQIKKCLQNTAKQILGTGWNQHTGYGITQVLKAFDRCTRPVITSVIADRFTRPFSDRITLAIRDRVTTAKKDVITSPQRDHRRTVPQLDQRGTIARLDQPRTIPQADRGGTAPSIDWVKNPRLDTLQEHLRPVGRQPIRPPIRQPIRPPFVLSTPHHAANWQQYDLTDAPHDSADLIEQLQQELSAAYAILQEHGLLGTEEASISDVGIELDEEYVVVTEDPADVDYDE